MRTPLWPRPKRRGVCDTVVTVPNAAALAAARAVRATLRVRPSAAAAAAGCGPDTLRRLLLSGRGGHRRCSAAAAAAVSLPDDADRAAAAALAVFAPGAAAVFAEDRCAVVRLASGAARATVCSHHDGDSASEEDAVPFAANDARALARFCATSDDYAAANAAQPPAVSLRLAAHPSSHIREAAATAGRSRAALAVAAADRDLHVQLAAIANRFCPPTAVAAAARKPFLYASAAVLNPAVTAATADMLARSPSEELRRMVASNPGCSPETLEMLCGPGEWRLAQAAALANPNCPPGLIRRFAISESDLRAAVASNPNCSSGVLDALSRDADIDVRAAVSANSACGAEVAWRLSADRDPRVRGLAVANACFPSEAMPGALERGASGPGMLRNPGCPPHLFSAILARWESRSQAAEHPAAPAEMLAEFTTSNDYRLRTAAARNPGCPRAAVARAAFDTASQVRFAALCNLVARSAKPWLTPDGGREPPLSA